MFAESPTSFDQYFLSPIKARIKLDIRKSALLITPYLQAGQVSCLFPSFVITELLNSRKAN